MDEPRRQGRLEKLGGDQLVDGARRDRAVDAGDLGGVGERRVVAEDRERPGDVADRRRVAPQPRGHEARDRRRPHGGDRARVDARGLHATLAQRSDELLREQRVARGRAGALGADRVAHVLAEAAADQPGDGRRAERRGPERDPRLAVGEQRQRILLARPGRDDQAGGELLDPRLEVGEEPQRVLVGPVRVVDEQGERDRLGQPRAQPVQAVEAREQAVVGGGAVGDLLEQWASEAGGAGEQPLALRARERLDARREQLYHHAECELLLHDAAARTEHHHPAGLGQRRGRVHQRALADARRALDHDDPAGPARSGAERIADLRQLGLALQEVGPAGQVRHVAPGSASGQPIPSGRPRGGKAYGGST